jgi:hypothetical protein
MLFRGLADDSPATNARHRLIDILTMVGKTLRRSFDHAWDGLLA